MAESLEFYRNRTFDFVERLQACSDADAIRTVIAEEMAHLGFECVTCWKLPPPGRPIDGIMMNTRPATYVEHYVEHNYAARDPVVTHLNKGIAAYSWGDVRASTDLSRAESDIIDEGREFSMLEGLVVPVVTRSGSLSLFSPCGTAPDLSPAARTAVEIMGAMALQILERAVIDEQRGAAQFKPLTAREREVLQWVAYGKSDDEIGEILRISAATVLSHVENAKRKLDTYKRTAAIATAIRRGEIAP